MFDWDTSGAKPLHGPPQGLSRSAGDHRLDSIWLKGAHVRAVRAVPRTANGIRHGNADSTPTGMSSWTFPSFTPSAWKPFVFCLHPEVLPELRTTFSTDISQHHLPAQARCVVCFLFAWPAKPAPLQLQTGNRATFCHPFLSSFSHCCGLSEPAVQPSPSAQKS